MWVDQSSCQSKIIVINWLKTIISPYPETFKITTLIYDCIITKLLHANTFCDKRSSRSEHWTSLMEDKQVILYSVIYYSYYKHATSAIDCTSVSCNNKDTVWQEFIARKNICELHNFAFRGNVSNILLLYPQQEIHRKYVNPKSVVRSFNFCYTIEMQK